MTQLSTDFKELSRRQFARKYLLILIMLLYFSWNTVGSIIEQNYTLANLNKITRQVERVIITPRQFDKNGKGKELRIFLKNSPEYFRLTDNYNYQEIVNQISRGDVITIFYRKKNQLKWGSWKASDIYHLQYNGSVLFDLSKRHENSFKITLVFGLGIVVLLGLSIFYGPKKSSA